ncbi:DNA translocase FtsK [Occallatibacter savannae]|uniref:DNA translocase FtsK n=1 Tax=Occallatibacter savannae TaxID=1002691 RepID=UPI000D6935F2|nr:DNA translocase FtsK [Occallatibacter savannae]
MKPIPISLSPTRSRALNVFLGAVLTLSSILLFLALATYHPSDPSMNTATGPEPGNAVHNWIGLLGSYLSDVLLQAFGLTVFLFPVWMGVLGWNWIRSRDAGTAILRWMGVALAVIFTPALFGLLPWHWRWMHAVPVEGVMGRVISGLLVAYLNIQGAWLVALVLAGVGIYFGSDISLKTIKTQIEDRWLNMVAWHDRYRNWKEDRAERKRELEERCMETQPGPAQRLFSGAIGDAQEAMPEDVAPPQTLTSKLAALFAKKRAAAVDERDPVEEIPAFQRTGKAAEEPIAPRRSSIWEPAGPAVSGKAAEAAGGRSVIEMRPQAVPAQAAVPAAVAPVAPVAPAPAAAAASSHPIAASGGNGSIAIHERADVDEKQVTVAPKHVSGYKLPPSTLLNSGDGPHVVREDELRDEAKVLVEKCAEFDVMGQVVQINPGPMVTTYEFKPEAGVKYSRVTGLAEDLCLAMRAESILIERMAGKSTVGIQVPNHERETIHLRDVLESETFAKAKSRLTLAMGKDINGRIVTADLASMPHVLIAGSTGSGKSVAINAMIMSLLYRTTPAQVRLILVDPKRVELGMYEGIPHLFTPIITEPKLAANALRNAVREMERRLKLLASRSVRNIDQYNKLFESAMPSLFDDGTEEQPLPYIVIIIDELADLMMLDRANVEESITRLAQMARAVGIHLVLATQRPSVDVITGLIKANVPTRISFRLATKVDSRTILDTNGAEALLGRGDMLFLPPGTSRLLRLHAPYVSEKETAAVVAFWKEQGQAEYVEGFLESPKEERQNSLESSSDNEDDNDPMFDDAVRLVFEFGKASTSLLQRRLRIGYGRAAHLIDLMERDGLVGPADGSRPRELLKAPGWLHEISVAEE